MEKRPRGEFATFVFAALLLIGSGALSATSGVAAVGEGHEGITNTPHAVACAQVGQDIAPCEEWLSPTGMSQRFAQQTLNHAGDVLYSAGVGYGYYPNYEQYDLVVATNISDGRKIWSTERTLNAIIGEPLAIAVSDDDVTLSVLGKMYRGDTVVLTITALAAEDASVLWTSEFTAETAGSWARLLLDVDAGILVAVIQADGGVRASAFSVTTGEPLWGRTLHDSRGVLDTLEAASVDSAVGRLYVLSTGQTVAQSRLGVWALGTRTGELLWQHLDSPDTYDDSYGRALAIDPVSGRVAVTGKYATVFHNYFVTMVLGLDGSPVWTSKYFAGCSCYFFEPVGVSFSPDGDALYVAGTVAPVVANTLIADYWFVMQRDLALVSHHSANGTLDWDRRYYTPDVEYAKGFALSKDGATGVIAGANHGPLGIGDDPEPAGVASVATHR